MTETTTDRSIAGMLAELYDDPGDALTWLESPQKILGGARPDDLIKDGQTERVRSVLSQLRDGVYP